MPEEIEIENNNRALDALDAKLLAYYEELRSAGASKESARRDVVGKYGVSLNRVYNLTRTPITKKAEYTEIKGAEAKAESIAVTTPVAVRIIESPTPEPTPVVVRVIESPIPEPKSIAVRVTQDNKEPAPAKPEALVSNEINDLHAEIRVLAQKCIVNAIRIGSY
jgi:hypothetical protein